MYLDVKKKLAAMRKDGTWPDTLRVLTENDLWALFIGRSTWYEGWNKTFTKLKDFPKMIKWLNRDEDSQEDLDLWGKPGTFHFAELALWIENGGTLVKKKKATPKAEVAVAKRSHKPATTKSARK
jgi:hypothetical protein